MSRDVDADSKSVSVIAAPSSAGPLYGLLAIPAICAALVVGFWISGAGGVGLAVVAATFGLFGVILAVWMRSLMSNARWAVLTANRDALVARCTTIRGGRAPEIRIPWTDVRDALPLCSGPSGASVALDAVALVALATSSARQPITAVVVKRPEGHAVLMADAFQLRPEVIARRIRRFRDHGAAGLRPSTHEIDAHRAQFTAARDLSAGSLREASILRLSREGIHAGRRESSARLYPWKNIVAAHVLPTVELLPEVVQVELVDGGAIDVRPRDGMSRVDLARLLAPRWVDESGAEHQSTGGSAG